MANKFKIFGGNACPELTLGTCAQLSIEPGKATVGTFSDGEIMVEIHENVRGCEAFILQSTCAPTNDHLMEVVIIADALRRASVSRITAVMPYFGYARQDRRVRSARVPITAKVVADMLASVGISRLLTVDLHADQIQGFFYMPVDNVYSTSLMIEDIHRQGFNMETLMVVSPDVGGVVRARAVAKRLNDSDLAIIDKRRPKANQTEVMNIIGQVEDRHCIIIDDIVDTAGTLCQAAKALKAQGAATVTAYCTHPVFSGNAIHNIANSQLDEVVVTNTIPLSAEGAACEKIRQLKIDAMLAEAIHRVSEEESVSSMFS